MKVLKNISIALGVLLALFIVVGLFLPSKWEVSRNMAMKANKEQIYSYVANLKKFIEWSPWTGEEDSTLVYTYEGPEAGVGAQLNWTSENMGNGWLKIIEAEVEKGIVYDLYIDMGSFQNTLRGQIAFETMGDETSVVWTDSGDSGNNIIKKWMSVMMDSMLGKDLEKGLLKLKSLVEKEESGKEEPGQEAQGAADEAKDAPSEEIKDNTQE